jgi:hypothetical protein
MAEKCPKLSAEIYPKVLAAYRRTARGVLMEDTFSCSKFITS